MSRAKVGRKTRAGDRCPICEKGRLRWGKVPYEDLGVSYGRFDAEICDHCGEAFLSEEASDAIEAKAKELGHWGITKRSKVGTSGHSLMVRIPKEMERALGISKGDAILIRPESKHRIVIEFEGAESEA